MSPQPLPRFNARAERAASEAKIARIILEVGATVEVTATVARATLAGDERRLRGIPVCGRGIASTSPGTDPLAEVIRRCA